LHPKLESEPFARLALDRFPRSLEYDPEWVLENLMGPHPLWLAEWVCEELGLRAGMRVLDLGCGKALTSVFLAREFGVQVWATDLWIGASENLARIRAAGADASVFPVHAEAHALPYAHGFFDAIVCVDAYHYFGTDDLYLARLAPLLAPGGRVAIAVPGLREELDEVPPHLEPFWRPDFWSFHSADWWARHWRRSGAVADVAGDWLEDAWRHWLVFAEVADELDAGPRPRPPGWEKGREPAMLRADAGRTLGFVRVAARAA
jgi:SAM-dependent methyltransferase